MMRCDKRNGAAFQKKTANRTQIKMLTSSSTLCTQKALFLGRIASDCGGGGLYVVFTMRKSAASRCFRHLIELCAPLIMDDAL